jgi:aromatic ring-opening dioxygenase catalytic subunit (LigB family)
MVSTPGAQRMPVAYVTHGGGPWPFVETRFGTKAEQTALRDGLSSISSLPATPPRAVLVVSAHWEERVPTLMTSEAPPMLYDYGGFPPESYRLQWPAPGAPWLAPRVRELLAARGIESAEDAKRGFDHGTFVPLKLAYPDAEVPTLQLSLKAGLDPAEHLAIGRALAPLRDEGVFIVTSGSSFHNMRLLFRPAEALAPAQKFDDWLRETVTAEPSARDSALLAWERAPAARESHPREEHLLPLMVAAGAAGADRGKLSFAGTLMDIQMSGYHFG